MTKRQKLEPITITSRQGLQVAVVDVVTLKLELVKQVAAMEAEIAQVQKKYQDDMVGLARQIDAKEAGIQVYCQKNRADLFVDKKSIDLLVAEVGFEMTPPRVEKTSGKDTFGKAALRLENLDWGAAYVRYPDPDLNKDKILADRKILTKEQLADAGLKIEQDENFFIRPKSQVAEQTVKEAA